MDASRRIMALIFAVALSAWATGQHRGGSTALEQLRQFQANSQLLEALQADNLRLSQADTTLSRATECHQAAKTLAKALEQSQNPERTAELGEHVARIVQEGLAPTLAEARQLIPPGSRDYSRLKELHDQTRRNLADWQKQFLPSSPLRRQLDQLAQDIPQL